MKKFNYLFAIVLATLTFSCAEESVTPKGGDEDDVIIPPPPPPPPPPPGGGRIKSDTLRYVDVARLTK